MIYKINIVNKILYSCRVNEFTYKLEFKYKVMYEVKALALTGICELINE